MVIEVHWAFHLILKILHFYFAPVEVSNRDFSYTIFLCPLDRRKVWNVETRYTSYA